MKVPKWRNLDTLLTNLLAHFLCSSQFINCCFKVQLFWKGHKNLKKSPSCLDKSGDLLNKRQNKRDFFSNLVAFSQCLNFNPLTRLYFFCNWGYMNQTVWICTAICLVINFHCFIDLCVLYWIWIPGKCQWENSGYTN